MDLISRLSDGYGKLLIFSGRATRAQFWTLYAANLVILLFCLRLGAALPDAPSIAVISLGFAAVSLGNLSVVVRRLHDTNRSGWWLLACILPIVPFAVMYFLLLPSVSGPTRFDAHARSQSHPVDPVQDVQDAARALGS